MLKMSFSSTFVTLMRPSTLANHEENQLSEEAGRYMSRGLFFSALGAITGILNKLASKPYPPGKKPTLLKLTNIGSIMLSVFGMYNSLKVVQVQSAKPKPEPTPDKINLGRQVQSPDNQQTQTPLISSNSDNIHRSPVGLAQLLTEEPSLDHIIHASSKIRVNTPRDRQPMTPCSAEVANIFRQ